MSFHVLSWVADHSPTKGAARLLLVMMADMANDEGWMEAKTATLASRCNVDSERAIQRQLHALEKAGAIRVIPQAADSGRSLNNAFVILTPGRAVKEIRSRPPRATKRSPSPNPESEAPRATKASPSHPDESVTLSPTETSPSPRPNGHPHKGTVLQEPFYRNHPQQQQQQAAREAARPSDPSPPHGWIDFNPKSKLQRLVVERVEAVTPGGSDEERREMLRTLSHTPGEGAVLEGSLRQASSRWLGMTLATAERFERENAAEAEAEELPA